VLWLCRITPGEVRTPHLALPFRMAGCSHRIGERKQASPLSIVQGQEQMGFLGVHQPQTEEWLLLAFLPVLPDAVNDLHLVELAERHHVVPEIGIAEHHVIEHLPAGQQQEVKPALLFVPFRQKAIHMQQGRFPVGDRCCKGRVSRNGRRLTVRRTANLRTTQERPVSSMISARSLVALTVTSPKFVTPPWLYSVVGRKAGSGKTGWMEAADRGPQMSSWKSTAPSPSGSYALTCA